jgi:hypothetical protein
VNYFAAELHLRIERCLPKSNGDEVALHYAFPFSIFKWANLRHATRPLAIADNGHGTPYKDQIHSDET